MLKKMALQLLPLRRLYEERAALADRVEAISRPQELSISIDRADCTHPMATLVEGALEIALAGEGVLPPDILAIEGMSGRKYRRFINALVAKVPDARYLEVGAHKGSTACAAVYGNAVKATLIDNWSQFGGHQSRLEFERNMARFSPQDIELEIIDQDFRAVAPESIGNFNIYLFDGPHSEADQYDGISLMQPALDDAYVLIVDDWNWLEVRAGTLSALLDLKSELCLRLEVRTTSDDSHPLIDSSRSDWHNGYFVACVRKRA